MDITRWSTPNEIRLITFFAAEDAQALYNQQNQDLDMTVVLITSSLLQNSDLKKVGEKN